MGNTVKSKYRSWLMVAAVSLFIHYLALALGQMVLNSGFSLHGFFQTLYQRFSQAGDTTRYMDIAQNGYVTEGENQINLVFYPLYPLLMRFVSLIGLSLPVSGMIVSQLSYAAASVFLYELILIDSDSRGAWYGVLFMALYPFSFFVLGVFTEGLFLLLSIAALYAIRKEKMVWAGCLGFLASLSRTQGMLLFFPAVYEWIAARFDGRKRSFRFSDLCLLLIPAGFCAYLFLNYALHGNFLQFLKYEADPPWYQSTQWISSNIAQHYSLAQTYAGLRYIIYDVQVALYFLSLAVLIYGVYKKERVSYILYGAVYLGFTYLSGWMISGGRYMLCCVPLFIILAKMKEGVPKRLLFAGSAFLFFIYNLAYMSGVAIM